MPALHGYRKKAVHLTAGCQPYATKAEGLIEKKSYQSICLTQAGKGQLQTTYHTYCELISYFSRIPTFTEEDRLESSLLCLGSFPHSRIEKLVRSADCIGTEKRCQTLR